MSGPRFNAVVSIVEDDASVRDSLGTLLGVMGYHVRTYASGEEFLLAHDVGDGASLILDIHLPGAGAFGVLEALANRGNPIPATVLITGQADEGVERMAAERNIRLLRKPVDGHALIEALNQAHPRPR